MGKNVRPCDFEGCERPRLSRDWCSAHYRQWTKHGFTYPIGDKEVSNRLRREAWARLSEEERRARLEPMHASVRGQPRSPEHRARLSESIRARWASGEVASPAARKCRGCESEFVPNSGNQFYCDNECKLIRPRLRRYGLTSTAYLELMEKQGRVCALCGLTGKGYGRFYLVIDHCHASGRVRGLLCPDCNTAIGRFQDDPGKLRRAAAYLEGCL